MMKSNEMMHQALVAVVGEAGVVTDPEKTGFYSRDLSFTGERRPQWVVFPRSTAQVREIVKAANEHHVSVVPRSSRVSLHGGSIPSQGGIVLDLRRMNQIVEINERNRYAVIEPGVTFIQLKEKLEGHGFRVAAPFLDPPSASIISTYMERSPAVTAADFTYGMEHVISYTVVTPTGELFTVGHPPLENTPASAPDGPGLNFYRIFQGAQGTLGIVTWMVIRVLPLPKAQRVFFFPCETIGGAVEIIRKTQRKELGLECLALNNFNAAALLLKETPEQRDRLKKGEYIGLDGAPLWNKDQQEVFSRLRKMLPPWIVVITLSAVGPIPDEKIAYQEMDLEEAIAEIGGKPVRALGEISGLDELFCDEFLLPWRMQKRFGHCGSCRPLLFSAAPDRVEDLDALIHDLAQEALHPVEEVGIYLQPMERARAFSCTYDLHQNPADPNGPSRIEALFDRLSRSLLDKGAFFDRPHGQWGEAVYSRAGTYTKYLKRIKEALDPNSIMNPGKLCFLNRKKGIAA